MSHYWKKSPLYSTRQIPIEHNVKPGPYMYIYASESSRHLLVYLVVADRCLAPTKWLCELMWQPCKWATYVYFYALAVLPINNFYYKKIRKVVTTAISYLLKLSEYGFQL